jgi:hypothetical protein
VTLELSAPAEENHVSKLGVLKQATQVFRQPTVRNLHMDHCYLTKNIFILISPPPSKGGRGKNIGYQKRGTRKSIKYERNGKAER